MCLSEGRREGEETVLGGKGSFHKAALETAKTMYVRNLLQAFLPASSSPPPPPFFSAAWKQNSFFSKQVVIIFMAWSISVCQENI